MKKYLKIMSFVALLSTGVNFNTERVSADTTRIKGSLPTTINLTEATDSQVSAYYSGVTGKKGNELLETLYHTINNHEEYSYDSSTDRNIYKIIDRDWDLSPLLNSAGYDYSSDNPYINKLYADYNGDTETADKFKNDDASRVSFDKEHIWPQSLGNFGRTAGAGSDFHALWPSDVKINQHAHNNNHYAVPTRSIKNYDNDKESYGGRNGFMDLPNTGKVFEPLDEYKGDIARAMFYMPARYFVYEDKTHPKLELVNGTPDAVTASSTITGKAGDLATLLEWHENDPVDEYEIRRNNLIYNNYQKNRNPFIDYPQWARIAYDTNYTGPGASNEPESSSVGLNSDPFATLTLESISVDTSKMKTQYFKNEQFSLSGLTVAGHYSEGNTRTFSNYISSMAAGEILSSSGTIEITVEATHNSVTKSTSFTIEVGTQSLSNVLYISEVYGAGGNSGSTYTHDFVELYNDSKFDLNLNKLTIQYGNPTDSTWWVNKLSGTIQANSYYLARFSAGSRGTVETPLGDTNSTKQMAATSIQILLVSGDVSLKDVVNKHEDISVIDFVRIGSESNFPGLSAISNPSVGQSITRSVFNSTIKNNATDFKKAAPTPTNSALSIANEIMKENTSMQCLVKYYPLKLRILKLEPNLINEDETTVAEQKQFGYFQESSAELMVNGRQRYEAWALYMNDLAPYKEIEDISLDINMYSVQDNNAALFISIVALVAICGYLLIKHYN